MSGSIRLRLPQTRNNLGRWVGPLVGRPTAVRQPNVIVTTREVRQAQEAKPDPNRYQEVRHGK